MLRGKDLEEFIEKELSSRICDDGGEVVIRFVRINYKKRELNFGLHSTVTNNLVELMSQKPGIENLRKYAIEHIQAGTNCDRKKTKKDIEEDLRFFARF